MRPYNITRYGKARQGGTRSNVCRERVLKAIGESEAGKTRLAAYEERTTRTMPERLEYDNKHKQYQQRMRPSRHRHRARELKSVREDAKF